MEKYIVLVSKDKDYSKELLAVLPADMVEIRVFSRMDDLAEKLSGMNYYIVIVDQDPAETNPSELAVLDSFHYRPSLYFLIRSGTNVCPSLGEFPFPPDGVVTRTDLSRISALVEDRLNQVNSRLNSLDLLTTKYRLHSKNPAFQKTLSFCHRVANSSANILLVGESGTGKEVAAQYIHSLSRRSSKNFVAVNCSSYTENLLESELFGHEKGAFTGALKARPGKFDTASHGTLFLDEVGDISTPVQIKLLRVIESKQTERLGSDVTRYIDFRLISATNRDLNETVEDGTFRMDFFYRISTIVISIPPLRDRPEDLNDLIDFFLERSQQTNQKAITRIDPEASEFLHRYDYPGNIRELKNIIDRMVILSENGVITKDGLPILYSLKRGTGKPAARSSGSSFSNSPSDSFLNSSAGSAFPHSSSGSAFPNSPAHSFPGAGFPDEIVSLQQYRDHTEAVYLKWVLSQTGGNVAEAARRLHITSRQLFNKINRYGLR